MFPALHAGLVWVVDDVSGRTALASRGETRYKAGQLRPVFLKELVMGKGNNSHRKEVKKKKAKKAPPKPTTR
jgi:hypothetical protein